MLKTELRERGDVVIADLTGRLTLGPGDRAVHDLVEGFLHAGGRNLVLNLSGIEYIDSSGVGELVRSLRTVRSRGSPFAARTASSAVPSVEPSSTTITSSGE